MVDSKDSDLSQYHSYSDRSVLRFTFESLPPKIASSEPLKIGIDEKELQVETFEEDLEDLEDFDAWDLEDQD
ncbi:hypothetical protein JZ751_026869 [Albula glossodonta]|uniref:Uncharacterized protein n=1 Tax=Albula glossodonta TaxID=121402 RepID=A0A8T2PAU8_9TELE|nr:hypothetical protein JZ751_026869 [Albula glossodonta]